VTATGCMDRPECASRRDRAAGEGARRWLPSGLPQRVPAVPAGVSDRMTWLMGDRLRRDHRPGSDGRCLCCELPFPCLGRRLGEDGVRLAETGSLRRPSPGLGRRVEP
jgi:hypothetical protein